MRCRSGETHADEVPNGGIMRPARGESAGDVIGATTAGYAAVDPVFFAAMNPCLFACMAHFVLSAPDEVVRFEGRALAAKDLPETVSAPVRAAAERLEPFAAKHKLRVFVGTDALVFVAPASYTEAPGLLSKLRAEEILFARKFEGVSAAPASAPTSAPTSGPASAPSSTNAAPAAAPATKPSASAVALELVFVEKKDAFDDYVDLLASKHDYLKPWAATAKTGVGFTLLEPLASVWRRDPKEKTEARPSNQLVHQMGHLLVNAAYGRQPYWAQEAIAWSLEQTSENAIYAFCHRNGFVSVKEHSGWPAIGRKWLAAQPKLPLETIFAMKRTGEIPRDLAAASLALVDVLVKSHREKLIALLAAFRKELDAKANDPGFELPPAKQLELWNAALGDEDARAVSDALHRS